MSTQAGWGGARTPANPAVVSGPGALSARTDGGGVMNPDAPAYGENLELQNLTTQVPLAGTPGAPLPDEGGGVDLSKVVGLGVPSQDQLPVTAGAAAGPGPGPEVLGLPMDPTQERRADARSLSPALLNALTAEASRSDATPSFKRRVREILSSV